MPIALKWNDTNDAALAAFLATPGATLRKAAQELGVSRSFAQRRAKALSAQNIRSICTREREDAGAAPLGIGHPISFGALVLPCMTFEGYAR